MQNPWPNLKLQLGSCAMQDSVYGINLYGSAPGALQQSHDVDKERLGGRCFSIPIFIMS